MKKFLISFIFITSVLFSFGQAQTNIVEDFQVVTTNQETFNLADFWAENPDTKVAIEFFFVDSPLCREISPIISDAYLQTGCNEHDVFFLSMNVSDDSTSVMNYVDTLGIQTPLVLSEDGGITVDTLADIHAYPTFVLLQKETFIPEDDTVWVYDDDEETDVVDSIIVYDEDDRTNFLEKDIWPITDIDSLMVILASHGIGEYECSGSGSNSSTGIQETVSFQSLFNLYPNPNDGSFYLTSNELEGNFHIEILDLRGKTIYQSLETIRVNSPSLVQESGLTKGIYILRIRHENETWSEKLIVQ